MPKPRVKELQEKIAALEVAVHNSESIIRKKTDSLDELEMEAQELQLKIRCLTHALIVLASSYPVEGG